MIGTGERAYAYAKACGILGKSFIGRRAGALNNISRLSELDRLIFPETSRDLPEKELLKDLEKRIINRAVESIQMVVNSYKNPPEFLVLLIRGWEFENLKNALTAISGNETEKPTFVSLERFGTIDFSAWPDLDRMLKGTEFEYLLKMTDKGAIILQTELDRHYYDSLWKALCRLGRRDKKAAENILSEEISLRNVVCSLRLRTYYQMEKNEVESHLINIKTVLHGRSVSLAADAISSLDFPLDNRQAWMEWRRAQFLNSENTTEAAGGWRVDPRYFQNAAARYLYRLARHSFRSSPFSLDTIFCFIKIKQFEEDILTSNAEGLGMGMTSREVSGMIGAGS